MTYENVNFSKPNMVMADGYFFMFDETNNIVVQKTASGNTTFIFPTDTKLLYIYYEADFSGNTYDSDLWTLGGTYGGFRDDRFWSRAAPGGTPANKILVSNFRLKGQFDVSVYYKNIIVPAANSGSFLNLRNLDGSILYLQISRRLSGGNQVYYCDVYNGSSWTTVGTSATTTDTEGWFRFYRASGSSTTTAYFKGVNATSWTTLGSTSTVGLGSSNNIQARLYSSNWSAGYNEMEAEFDNFSAYTLLSSIKSIQYDGRYFWTLQAINGTNEPVIRKWLFNNYECKLQQTFVLANTTTNTFYSNAFAIEHYITKLINPVSAGAIILNTEEYSDNVIASGTVLSIGPNRYDFCEDVTVSGVIGTDIVLTSGTAYDYETDSKVCTSRSILLLNDYYGTTSTSGSLVRLSAIDGSYISSDPRVDYKSVVAATFARVRGLLRDNEQEIYDTIEDAYTLIYVKDTNAKFRNLSDLLSVADANSVNDDFTGVSGAYPDATKWVITNGDPRLYNDTLVLSTDISGNDEIQSAYVVLNDFDVQVSGSLSNGYTPVSSGNAYFDQYMQISIDGAEYSFGLEYRNVDFTTISGLLVEYTMDSVSGTVIYDTSENGNHATCSGITYTAGKIRNAAVIKEKTDYIKLGSTVSGTAVSVSMWYYYDGCGTIASNVLVSSSGGGRKHITINKDTNYIGFDNEVWYPSGTVVVSGAWSHIVLTKNGANSKIYLNNSLVQDSNSSFNNSIYPIYLIGNDYQYTRGTLGKIDGVRIYDSELTTPDIEKLYLEGVYYNYLDTLHLYANNNGTLVNTQSYHSVPRCATEYTMDSVDATTIYDTSGYGYNATFSGITFASGIINNAAIIDSKSDYIELDTPNNSSTVSVSMWYYFDGFGGDTNTLLGNETLGVSPLYISLSTSRPAVYNHIGYESTTPLVSGTWYHIVLTKNGSNSKIYLDKTLIHDIDTGPDNAMYPIQTIGNKRQVYYSGSTTNLIPDMTSNTAPAGIASASTQVSSSYYAWRAMDRSTTTTWLANATTGWISYQFTAPVAINRYTIVGGLSGETDRAPNTWTFEGWDGYSWITLHSQSGVTWTALQSRTYDFSNGEAFIQYRLNITANNGDLNYLGIVSWEMAARSISTGNLTRGAIGKIDHVKMFNRVLTQTEIDNLYNEVYYNDSSYVQSNILDYLFRMTRAGGTLSYYYKPVISGVPDASWTSWGNTSIAATNCYLALGIQSQGLTVSGAIFDDLYYASGSIMYPLTTIPYYDIMTMDNLRADNVTTIPVYAISYYDGTLYRLQQRANYYGTDYTWTTYNYVTSTVRPFIDSITVTAYPTILPADGRNVAEITCTVLDQFGNGKTNAPVTFSDNDDYGYVTINPQNTDNYYGNGEVITYYKAGVDIHTVTITARVTQYD